MKWVKLLLAALCIGFLILENVRNNPVPVFIEIILIAIVVFVLLTSKDN